MALSRLIPVLLLKNGLIVRSQFFKIHQIIGNPITTVHRLSNWSIDELIVLDISEDDYHDMRRDDLHVQYSGSSTIELLKQIASVSFMPISFGGRVRNLQDIQERLSAGADKCVINTEAVRNPQLIEDAARQFGSQCIVVSIDVLLNEEGTYEVMIRGGKEPTGLSSVEWAQKAEQLGAGEILLNSINNDGFGEGYDIELIRSVTEAVSIPVIACGGVGGYHHFAAGVKEGGASAIAAANIFHFFELSYPNAKQTCVDAGLNMRPVQLDSPWFPREPIYDQAKEDARFEKRLEDSRLGDTHVNSPEADKVVWCTKCLYPSLSAAPMSFDDEGVCMGCKMSGNKTQIDNSVWEEREKQLITILEKGRCAKGSRHDCIITVSGGKDSYFQTHYIKNVLGFNPLLVTYYGNNFSEVGKHNLYRMKEVFGVDHHIYYPSVDLLKKLNRLGFMITGDMNWHNHIGISTMPMKLAAKLGIPNVIWGEHGFSDLSGQFSLKDLVEWTYRYRVEHYCRGFEWNYMVGREGITATDMAWYQYPTDEEMFKVKLRGLHLNNYVLWEANAHTQMVIDKYGWQTSNESFERTYRKMSNLDDIHENGAHDYLKYIKLGYGRCTDHASKDIRSSHMGREKGIELVRHHDPIKPSDLKRWLQYVGMSEDEFDKIADTFRDRRVWKKTADGWVKRELWAEEERRLANNGKWVLD